MPDSLPPRPVVLAVLDGLGENPDPLQNAVAAAKMPSLAALKAHYPHGLLAASALQVGLPEGQMGNSEVGHMNIGSGRVLMQELPRIDEAIKSGALALNPALLEFIGKLRASRGACHLLGLLSPGGVHSHQRHMAELARLVHAQGVPVKIHAFLDGRDTPPKSALEYVEQFKRDFPQADFVTVQGRYFAMDRDKRWDRTEMAHQTIMNANGIRHKAIETAIEISYVLGKTDEFISPTVLGTYTGMKDGDGLLMANFRSDRVRQILPALLDPNFKPFYRHTAQFAAALGMVEYSAELAPLMKAMFAPEPLKNILGEVVAAKGLKQLRIAETEKYAHVTFFFNGGREEPFAGEERILVPSPRVATYDLKPEMSAPEVTDKLVEAIKADKFDFIVVNYANCDMVGHTGNLAAATKAAEAVDTALGRVWAAVEAKGGALLITADHGNAEQMFDKETNQPHTAHTLNLVPVILAGKGLKGKQLAVKEGKLADIAPTILQLMHIPQPAEMTGASLLQPKAAAPEPALASPKPVEAIAAAPVAPAVPAAPEPVLVSPKPVETVPVAAAPVLPPAPALVSPQPVKMAAPAEPPVPKLVSEQKLVLTPPAPAPVMPVLPPVLPPVSRPQPPLQQAAVSAAPVAQQVVSPPAPPAPTAPAGPPKSPEEMSLSEQIANIAKEIEARLQSGVAAAEAPPADQAGGTAAPPADPQEKPVEVKRASEG